MKSDNGKEFDAEIIQAWAESKKIKWDFGRKFTPTD